MTLRYSLYSILLSLAVLCVGCSSVALAEAVDVPPADEPTDTMLCLNNISISVGSFSIFTPTDLGTALCNIVGEEECIDITFVGTTSEIVTVYEPSIIPGSKEPQAARKLLSHFSFLMYAYNRSVALSSIVNAARYPSNLTTYQIQTIRIANISTVYERVPDPIISYIGNTAQCTKHFWYVSFCIVCLPVLVFLAHLSYHMGRESGKELAVNFGFPPPPMGGGTGYPMTPVPQGAATTTMNAASSVSGATAMPTQTAFQQQQGVPSPVAQQPPTFSPQSTAYQTPQMTPQTAAV